MIGDAALRRGDHQRLSGLLAECRGIAGKGLDIVARTGDGDADQERVGGGIFCDHRKNVTEQAAVGQQRCGQIDRVGRRRKTRQDILELLVGFRRQRRHRHADGGCRIGRQDADRAGIADRDQPPALRLPAFQIKLGRLDQPAHVRSPPDAVMLEERVDHAVLVGERAGMRLRRLAAGFGAAGFQRDDRQVAIERHGGEFFQIFLLRDALEIKQQQLHLGILGDGDREFADRDVRIVAGGVGVTDADAALAQESDRHGGQRAALAEHRDVPLGPVHVHEHGGEARDRAGAEVGEALRVRADDAHAGLVRDLDHAPLLGLAHDGVDLAEARRHHHRDLDAARGAILHRADGVVAGDCDDHHVGRFRQIGQAVVAFVTLHLGARRIDRENLALEAELVEVMHRPAADLVGIFRRTDDGDGFWIECGLKTAHDLVLAK